METIEKKLYTEEEYSDVKAYILEQYAQDSESVEILPADSQLGISVVKIVSDDHITYVTLGLGAYLIKNSYRKDMQYFELVMLASRAVTDEQEACIIAKMSRIVLNRLEEKKIVLEWLPMRWLDEEDDKLFERTCVILMQSSWPLESGKKTIQFMLALPLWLDEDIWLSRRISRDWNYRRDPVGVLVHHGALFIKHFTDRFHERKDFYLDGSREELLSIADERQDYIFGINETYIPWGVAIGRTRKLAYSLWQREYDTSPAKPKKTSVSKNFKYEDYKNGVEITSYIGTDLEVTVPAEIGGKPVVKIGDEAFSAEIEGQRYWRIKETRAMLKKVTLPDTVQVIGSSAFEGCGSLEELSFNEKTLKRICSRTAFLGCDSLPKAVYGNATYLSFKKNPYFALIDAEEKAPEVTVHPDTKLIADRVLNPFNHSRVVVVPAAVKNFSYDGTKREELVFRVVDGSSAAKFLKKNGYNCEEVEP